MEAARATGESTPRIILFEILPNLTAVIASGFVGTVIFAVLTEITSPSSASPTSPTGTGAPSSSGPSPTRPRPGAWWWFVPAGLCIALLGTALALINFGIDEFVNPRLRTATGSSRKVKMRVGFTPVARKNTGDRPREHSSKEPRT